MKRYLLLAFGLTVHCAMGQGHVPLPLTVGHLATRDGKVFENVTIVAEDSVGVKISHEGGLARVAYDRLPDDLAKKFATSAAEGKVQLAEEEQKKKEEEKLQAEAMKNQPKDAAPAKPAAPEETQQGSGVEGPPKLDGDSVARIAALQAYIAKLQRGIDEATKIVADSSAKAAKYRSTAAFNVVDASGKSVASGYNNSTANRADFQERQAAKAQEKIQQAQDLMRDAQSKISVLKASLPK